MITKKRRHLVRLFEEAVDQSKQFNDLKIVHWKHISAGKPFKPYTKIDITDNTPIETANLLTLLGEHPIVLCWAQHESPGRGVDRGATNEEAVWCRVSNLWRTALQAKRLKKVYPLMRPYMIQDLIMFKDQEYKETPFAALDIIMASLKHQTEQQIEHIIQLAILGSDPDRYPRTLVLGVPDASNPMMNEFYKVLVDGKYAQKFDKIIFAVGDFKDIFLNKFNEC